MIDLKVTRLVLRQKLKGSTNVGLVRQSNCNINKQFQPFDTGIPDLDELLEVLLSTSMFTSGILGCLFDNILPGLHLFRNVTTANLYFSR